MKRLLFSILLASISVNAFAWSEAGHLISSEAATIGLPTDMPQFFYRAFPQLVWLGPEPDRIRGGGESLDAFNSPNHFLDYEYVATLDLPRDRYKFLALMDSSGTLKKHGIRNSETGFLPWRIAELSDELTVEFRLWRASEPGSIERLTLEREIVRTAGHLGHYVADAANPHHATINFNGWVTPNSGRFAVDCEAHDRFERFFVSHAMTTNDVVARLRGTQLRSDYFGTAVAFIRESNSLVQQLYTLDRDGAFDLFRPVSPEGKAFTAERLAAGASLLRDYWWSAWRNSANRPKRRGED